jgi:uncharacterized membrane protein YgcG
MTRPRQLCLAGWLALLVLCAPVPSHAQRQLHWDALEVVARLDAGGVLHVTETQRMVFTGDWNGGERVFILRPYHQLSGVSVSVLDPATGQEQPLTEDSSLDDVNEFSLSDERTLRWRSRLPSDAPFANDRRTYVIRYALSGVLLKDNDADRYRLNHDFAFPDRDGAIARFSLQLTLDAAWQPESDLPSTYTAGPLEPGESFFVSADLRYLGTGSPLAADMRRPPIVTFAVVGIALASMFAIAAFFIRESKLGRFVRVEPQASREWVAKNILALPAEVVGAAWDGAVGPAEVVALLARMVAEGKLSSNTGADGSLTLTLNVDRDTLTGYELALVKGLFFDGGRVTSTDDVKAHYRKTGFDPAKLIAPKLESRVRAALPGGRDTDVSWRPGALLLLGVFGLLAYDAFSSGTLPDGLILALIAVVLGLFAKIPGIALFRRRVDLGRVAAVLCLVPAFVAVAGIAAVLWFFSTPDQFDLSRASLLAIAGAAVWIVHAGLNALKSRQSAAAIAFRKRLTAGRRFFISELAKEKPALRDDWFPWVLAFGLAGKADGWSKRYAMAPDRTSGWSPSTFASSGSTTSGGAWTGAGGGRSGGAGASATWAAAAGGMAAGVSAPSSSSSGGGGGGSSSGGGGGGGW